MREGRGRIMGCAAAAVLLAACGGAGGSNVRPTVPPVVLASFSDAAVVFGQPVFGFSAPNQGQELPTGATLACPGMAGLEPLYLPDVENHRVLGFRELPIINNLAAHFVLGQPGPTFAFPGVGATAMRLPVCAHVSGGRLYVSDSGNHRVLVWHTLPDSSGAPADLVIGQGDFTRREPTAGPAGMTDPAGLCERGGRLFVVDRGNHRVLLWNGLPEVHGAPFDLVLGQPDEGGGLPNAGGAPSAATLLDPCAVWTDGQRVVVADRGNHRVLIWSSLPATFGAPADLVLGQPDFETAEPGLGALRLDSPSDVASDGTRLFVADAGNHRVLVWDTFPTTSQAPPDRVLGQSSFDHGAPNDDDQDGIEDEAPTARTLKSKEGFLTVALGAGVVCVGDAGNHRLLLFRGL